MFLNFLLIIICLAISEYKIYKINSEKFFGSGYFVLPATISYITNTPAIHKNEIENYFNGKDNILSGRLPEGLNYKNPPITIFGCSFAYGQFLDANQTFSHKLSKILQCPVYNRAIPAQSFQEMYYQSTNKSFYEQVPPSDTVIYIMISDHYRRSYVNTVGVTETYFLLHYKIKNGNLIYEKYDNPILNFFKSLYTVKLLNIKYFEHYINNPKNADKITDDTLLYFIKTRENLEAQWKNNIKFYVIFYADDILYSDLLKEKLQSNGFKVIETKDLTDADLYDDFYLNKDNRHPSEAVWDLLTPDIARIISNYQ